jgi:hypothetical protein
MGAPIPQIKKLDQDLIDAMTAVGDAAKGASVSVDEAAALSVAASTSNASVEQLSIALKVLVDRYPEEAERLRQSLLSRASKPETIEFERQKRGRKIIL